LETLEQRLELEGVSSIHKSVSELTGQIRKQNWKQCLDSLQKILDEISPLNVNELFRLVNTVDEAAELIKEQEIILLLGGTGTGKSTTIHFLAGSKMTKTRVGGLNHIEATQWRYAELEQVISSPFAKSETRRITPVPIRLDDIGILCGGKIVLCDTPGFEDTRGAEIDIANGISIIRAIHKCRKVKPVVLISYKSIGDRFEGVRKLTHLLARLMPGISQQINTFSYIFTKYPSQERGTIHASLENISSTLNEQEKSDKI
jgi:energy-coupling factor transporter ATP-binding protein EcfA2